MDKLSQLLAERQVLTDEVGKLFAKEKSGTPLTDTELDLIEEKNAQIEALGPEIDRHRKIAEIAAKNAARQVAAEVVNNDDRVLSFAGADSGDGDGATAFKSMQLPVRARGGNPKNLMRLSSLKNNREEAQKVAYSFGMWALASVLAPLIEKEGSAPVVKRARDWCKANGITMEKAQAENINTSGGFLVPIILANYIIELRENFGVVRSLFHRSLMTSDTLTIPRRTGSVNAYWLTDNNPITPSTKTFDQVTITANKLASIVLIPSEISEDSIVDIGDNLAQEIAWKFSYMEDSAGILGDGTSAYGGNLGIIPALQAACTATTTDVGGIHVAPSGSGASWGSIVLSDLTKTMGLLPDFAYRMGDPVWLTSRQFYETVMVGLLAAAGGNRVDTLEAGASRNPRFLGYDVHFSQVMPRAAAVSSVPVLFGNFGLAAEFGDRRELTLALSTEYAFITDQIAIRGISRFGITIHDVGGNNAAAQAINPANSSSDTVAGPVVGLQTYTS